MADEQKPSKGRIVHVFQSMQAATPDKALVGIITKVWDGDYINAAVFGEDGFFLGGVPSIVHNDKNASVWWEWPPRT